MMHNWFECKIRYEKMMENGMQKKVTGTFLVDALSFAEAEARIIMEIRPFITGEFTVSDIKRARLSELFFNVNGDRFYKIKVYFITLDEKSGAEKKTAANMLVQASNVKDAITVLEEGMKGTLADYTIASVTETSIMYVFPYSAEGTSEAEARTVDESVQNFINSCPQGSVTTVTIAGKEVVVDKTTNKTVVKPKPEADEGKNDKG